MPIGVEGQRDGTMTHYRLNHLDVDVVNCQPCAACVPQRVKVKRVASRVERLQAVILQYCTSIYGYFSSKRHVSAECFSQVVAMRNDERELVDQSVAKALGDVLCGVAFIFGRGSWQIQMVVSQARSVKSGYFACAVAGLYRSLVKQGIWGLRQPYPFGFEQETPYNLAVSLPIWLLDCGQWVANSGHADRRKPPRKRLYCGQVVRLGPQRQCFTAAEAGKLANNRLHLVLCHLFRVSPASGIGNPANPRLCDLSMLLSGAAQVVDVLRDQYLQILAASNGRDASSSGRGIDSQLVEYFLCGGFICRLGRNPLPATVDVSVLGKPITLGRSPVQCHLPSSSMPRLKAWMMPSVPCKEQ